MDENPTVKTIDEKLKVHSKNLEQVQGRFNNLQNQLAEARSQSEQLVGAIKSLQDLKAALAKEPEAKKDDKESTE